MVEGVGLADAIESLRRELQEAVETGRDERLRFKLSPIELTLHVALSKDASGKVSAWRVIELGGSAATEQTQTLKLTLEPGWLQATGEYLGSGQWTVASQSPASSPRATAGPE